MAKKKRNIKFGFIFWIVFIILVILLFFINKENIQTVLKNFNFKDIRKEKTENVQLQIQDEIERINAEMPSENETPTENTKNESQPASEESSVTQSPVNSKSDSDKKEEKPETKKTETTKTKPKSETKKDTANSDKKVEVSKTTEPKKSETSKTKVQTRTANIYFVNIDSDGLISRVPVRRNLPVSDSPMSDALKSLFSGTTSEEAKKSYRSLIPPNTKLLSATVRDGIAYINVSESFEFNKYGIEGYLAELAQVVYTATEFSTVNSVQFLIEGQKKNYLGSDGVWIGSPLSRASFK